MTERKNIFSNGDIWAILFLLACMLIGGAIMIYQKHNRNQPPELIIETVGEADFPQQTSMQPVTASAASRSLKININSAPADSFELLSGIGPVYAERIVKYRQNIGYFQSLEQLMDVRGIGQRTFDKIKNYLTLE
ncbi:MAG: helix-hairpin-helix domain-containing protein [candidate division Zixibacteria bacterium]|nr:helix-hairpin-helix domain-containing protein [candidate division Zixibacteria bacterium]